MSDLGPRTIQALGLHINKLTELKLTSLHIDSISQLASLPTPPLLAVLVLTDSMPAGRDEEFYAVVSRLAGWIRSCKALRKLELRRFVDDARLLSQALDGEDLKLETLSMAGYSIESNQGRAFHITLPAQKSSLRRLYLNGMGSSMPEYNNILFDAVGEMKNLRELELKDISDYFTNEQIISLTSHLPNLEKLWISGEDVTDEVWSAFLQLPKLRTLIIQAICEFTAQGILDFVSQLGPERQGFSLSILNAVKDIAEEAQIVIRDVIREQLGGSFDFGLARGAY